MKKNSFFFITFVILVSLFASFGAYGQNNKGYEQCTALSSLLKRYSFYPLEQPLLEKASEDYPFNIILTFNENSLSSDNNPDEINTLILAFNIQDAIDNISFTISLLENIRSAEKTGNIVVAFTYGDTQSSRNPYILSGTRIYVESLTESENVAAIPINLKAESNMIIPGSGGDCSPAWLIHLLSNSFYDNGIRYVIRGGILSSLYRLNFLKNDYRTAIFMMNGIPACGLDLYLNSSNTDADKKIQNFFGNLCISFDPENTLEWDRHSRPVQIFNKTIILNEHFTVIFFIIAAVLSLFFICQFSFIVQFSKRDIRKNVMRLWYMIPSMAFLTTMAFILEQGIAFIISRVIPLEPISFIIFKLSAAFIVISFVFFLFIRRVGIYSSNVYSYFMTITSLMNLFIFSAIDLSLFYLFLTEYVLINLTRPLRRTGSLVASFFLIAIPFVPYVYQLIMYAETRELTKIVFAPFYVNLIFSFAFLPFEFVWLRLLTRLNGRWRIASKKKKAFIRQNLITIGSAIALFIIILIVIIAFIPDEYRVTRKKTQFITENAPAERIVITRHDEDFFGDTIRTITIQLAEKTELLTIAVKGTNSIPVLYSDEEMLSDAAYKTDYFLIPSWAPETMSFSYIPEDDDDSSIVVTEQKTDLATGNIILSQQILQIPAKKKGGN